MSRCDDCPFNSGVHGEEIICDLDMAPNECPRHNGEADE